VLLPWCGLVARALPISAPGPVVRDPANDPSTTDDRTTGSVGETVAVPLIGADDSIISVLTVSRAPAAEPFDQLDLELVTAVAAHAGLALHLSRVRADAEKLRLLADREQIGEDLRHHVIHRLFRHGLALQFAGSRSTDPLTRVAVQTQIDEVDEIIRDIRTAVFALSPARPTRTPTSHPEPSPGRSALVCRAFASAPAPGNRTTWTVEMSHSDHRAARPHRRPTCRTGGTRVSSTATNNSTSRRTSSSPIVEESTKAIIPVAEYYATPAEEHHRRGVQ
jgi:GAF domain-containing protein